jgi:hypothetical protein
MAAQELTTLRMPQIRYWHELAIVSLMAMELSWLVPWYRSLTPETYSVSIWRIFIVLFAIILLANISTRIMNYLDLKLNIRRGVTVGLIVICVFVGLKLLLYESESLPLSGLLTRPFEAFSDVRGLIPDEFLVILFVLLVYWRGMSLASKYIDPRSVRQNFYLGLGMYTAYIFINTLVTGETPGMMLYLFFVSALIALGSARIFTISQLRGGVRNPFDLRWFLGIFITALVVVGLAGFIAWLFSVRTSIVGGIGGIVMGIFGVLMLVLISPVIFLVERFAASMPDASGAVQSVIDVLADLRNTFGGIANNLFNIFNIPSLLNWMQLLKPILLWSFVLAILFALLFSISRWFVRERQSSQDERESIIDRSDLIGLFRQALKNRLDQLSQSLSGRTSLRGGQRWLAAAKIRRIYARLMELSSKLGEPRPPANTPLEFLPKLEGLLPEGRDEIRVITEAYMRIRYGELPETNQEINQVEEAWERVNAVGKEKYSQMPKEQRSSKSKTV